MKDKNTAGILALLLGWIGGHKFYLDRPGQGILYLVFSWTFIPGLLGLLEGIRYLTMPLEEFNAKYNYHYLPGNYIPMLPGQAQQPQAQNIVVNVATAGQGARSVAEELKALNDLRRDGALTEEEFQEQKRKLLGGS
jgi:TM2 domain-containing membrane protein YozV